jgi:hypothetical protein
MCGMEWHAGACSSRTAAGSACSTFRRAYAGRSRDGASAELHHVTRCDIGAQKRHENPGYATAQ